MISTDNTDSRTETTPSADPVVDFLRRSDAYHGGEAVGGVQCIETHISWVFLTRRFAYKLKKPVRFDFLDFSTAPLRRDACRQEVSLNRRLAPDVYIGVIPVTADGSHLELGGRGRPVDWMVKMRRLPANRSLDRLILSGAVTTSDINALSKKLLDFYDHLTPLWLPSEEYLERLEQHVRANRSELLNPTHQLDASTVKRIHGAQLRLLLLQPQWLTDRVAQGRIVEGHGDLRPEHIYFVPTPVMIDCIEFRQEYRQLDVLDELCFLAMECDQLGAEWLGRRVLDDYISHTGDAAPEVLQSFYRSYRACVRAKVQALSAGTSVGEHRRELLEAAEGYLRAADQDARTVQPPLLLVMRGLSGSGKTTVATALADALGMELLQTDQIRRERFGPSESASHYGEGRYQPQHRQAVYQSMFRRAEQLLANGLSVVLDGSFLTPGSCEAARELAQRQGAEPFVVECTCPEDVALARIVDRMDSLNNLSEARADIYRCQKQERAQQSSECADCTVDTTSEIEAIVHTVIKHLRKRRTPLPG